jgi:GTP-binding protein EngB required for normal cell division
MVMPDRFNEPQRSRILAGVSYMDKLLVDIDEILATSDSNAFPKYKNPLSPVQVRTVRDYIKRLRQQITQVLKTLEITLPEAKFDSTHSARVTLQFIEVAIEGLSPGRLAGYGEVPENFLASLVGGLQEMKGIVRQMDSYLILRSEADLNARLTRLSDKGALTELLRDLAAIIDRHGFVEFRAPLSRLVDKVETPAYEIAFFGRVSSGKSSLLNRIMGTDLLPTGVTPVTAIPTRIRNRPESALLVWSADGRLGRYVIARLADFVTEARNPGNDKRVTRLIVEVPLAILPEAVVLVDTPGLGSLALEGATETMAYLPRCDLGVVLVDASSNLNSDDVATLDALRAASVSSLLVLSKADLVGSEDLQKLVEYSRSQVIQQLGTTIDVTPLSSHSDLSYLLKKWIAEQISPRIANAQRLAAESSVRKANAMAQRILHALEMSVRTEHADQPASPGHDLRNAETQLREAAGMVEITSSECYRITGQIRSASNDAIEVLAGNAVSIWQTGEPAACLNQEWLQKALNSIAQNEAQELASLIRSAARTLSEALDNAARATATGEPNEHFSFESFVKDMPVPDFAGCAIELRRPHLLAISTGVARRFVRGRIESKCGVFLERFFTSYARALELWFRDTLGNLEREFNGSAEVYRAQLQRLTASAAIARPDKNIVLEDIAVLKHRLGITEAADQPESQMTA